MTDEHAKPLPSTEADIRAALEREWNQHYLVNPALQTYGAARLGTLASLLSDTIEEQSVAKLNQAMNGFTEESRKSGIRLTFATLALVGATVLLAVVTGMAATAASAPSEMWERTRQCAEQAAKAFELTKGLRKGATFVSHYSPTYGKCFFDVNFGVGYVAPEVPGTADALFDAFRYEEIAGYTWDKDVPKSPLYCHISETGMYGPKAIGDCAAARQFAIDRMTK